MFENILFQLMGFAVQAAPAVPALPVSAAPAAAQTVQQVAGQAASNPLSGAFTVLCMIVYGLVCLALVLLVMFQNSKQDGLAGLMGGGMQNVFRGKQSVEQKISGITTWVATAFILCSIGIYFLIVHAQ